MYVTASQIFTKLRPTPSTMTSAKSQTQSMLGPSYPIRGCSGWAATQLITLALPEASRIHWMLSQRYNAKKEDNKVTKTLYSRI